MVTSFPNSHIDWFALFRDDDPGVECFEQKIAKVVLDRINKIDTMEKRQTLSSLSCLSSSSCQKTQNLIAFPSSGIIVFAPKALNSPVFFMWIGKTS